MHAVRTWLTRSPTDGRGRAPAPPWRTEGLDGPRSGSGNPRRRPWRLLLVLLLLGVNLLLSNQALSPARPTAVSYTFFTNQVAADNVRSVTSTAETIQGLFRTPVGYPPGTRGAVAVTSFETQRPAFARDDLLTLLQQHHVDVNAAPPVVSAPWWQQLLVGVLPTILLVALLVWISRRALAGGGAGGLGGIGRSRARRYQPEAGRRVTFADVAGIDEVRDEVAEIVDFLRHPERYRAMGAQIPRGVLLSGPPGTGKTLLARATAGEAEVPFFAISASEFIEMIVGVGASRVRDLFDQAKQVAPAIIFIDELDAIGRSRGGGHSLGGHDEREQTLNQVLTEMDGFTGSEGVVVLAATNRPEILDPALLRPGRFDRRVTVSPPDLAGRRAILAVHTRGIPLAPDVDLDTVAAATPGMVGADLKNLVNEAALLAARRGRDRVVPADLQDALDKVLLGSARGIMLTPAEKRRTAVHESGHALLGMLTPGADPVRKVSIIPRGRALGVTMQSPEVDRYGWSAEFLRGRIVGALGGRAAEEVVYGDLTTGAENDLEECTRIARAMVGRWGMSLAVGPVSVLPPPGQENPFGPETAAPATRQLVDREVRRLIEQCHDDALRILRAHRPQLDALTARLLEAETLDEDEAYAAAGVNRIGIGDDAAPVLSAGGARGRAAASTGGPQ